MRTRLTTGQRREQLLTIGAGLFAKHPYDEVWIEEVAEIAGVSRGLLYHYFPTKRDFFAEIVRSSSERLLEMSAPDADLPLGEQLAAGLDVYLDFARTHPEGYRVIHRAAGAVDDEIRQIRDTGMAANGDRILAALAALKPVDDAARLAVRGWLAFVVALCLEWLDHPEIGREQVRALCLRTFFAAVEVDPRAVGFRD
ncbi:TetR/AcrR family transcriptional regulator [Amycolatopsis sp. H20-H5]|uniref:TetR/AcrR family transcriptional regulator n=1 Tax=Amycolatopsis sp. H20-H5 TaxID=3046309 RepID=UPI002DC02413|nr:TetR/AcrR family transcriptional regulator [Amycolatopsis sp. H20-H5]MEC3980752.1 TetR/AcrR family transcriptional regulator [Amycolatopsis sp. H20-H5]